MKRFILILLPVCLAAPLAWCAPDPVNDLFKQAQAANGEHRFDDAVHLYEQILAAHPEAVPDGWYFAQRSIAETLARKGDFGEAAKAAHLCLDAAPNPQAFHESVVLAASILSALDKNVDRANQFLAFQQSGTAAGAVNPMDAVGYPSLPDREHAFESMRQQAGETPAASRLRAFTFLLTGRPKEALAQFADAFRRSSTVYELETASRDLAVIALRAARGHSLGMETDIQFVMFGPNGPDGKPGTADDIPDPFAQFHPATPPPGEGGLAGIAPDDLASLRKVRDAARLYIHDADVPPNLRETSLAVLQRVNDALDNWSADEKNWYLQIASQAGQALDWPVLYIGIQTAARDRALHFGGARAFWAGIDAECAAKGIQPAKGMIEARKQLESILAAMQKITFPKSAFQTLKQPASF